LMSGVLPIASTTSLSIFMGGKSCQSVGEIWQRP
jgi:hypothetical protein